LSAFAFLDARLLLALPVSLIKYPLSFLIRDPISTTVVLTLLLGLSYTEDPVTTHDVPLSDLVASFSVALLETAVFARLLLKTLLVERNEILAQNILEQCKLYKVDRNRESKAGWFGFLNNNGRASTVASGEIIYVPESTKNIAGNDSEKVVVAVLGMAHCNGIMKLLKEQKV
jgi:hypothetical protein